MSESAWLTQEVTEHRAQLDPLGVVDIEQWADDDDDADGTVFMVDLSPIHAVDYCRRCCGDDWTRYYSALEAELDKFLPPGYCYEPGLMEPEQADCPKPKKTDLTKLVAAWTPDDVAQFMQLVDCDWEARADDPTQHMVFRPEHAPHYLTERHGGVERPLYRVGGWYYDARRISSLLFNQEDVPPSSAVLTMACGHQFCIHPRHIQVEPRSTNSAKRNKRSNAFCYDVSI